VNGALTLVRLLGLNTFLTAASPEDNKTSVYLTQSKTIIKTFTAGLEKSRVGALQLGEVYSKVLEFWLGRRMVAHICQKSRGVLPSPSLKVDSLPASDLGILPSDRLGKVGSRQRIIELYDLLRPRLRAYLCCLGMSTDQAEDIIQDTFLRLISLRFDVGVEENLHAWIFRVAHNLSMDFHRSQRRWSRHNDEDQSVIHESIDPAPGPEQQVLLEERMRRFERTFAQLTPKQRQCVLLRAEGFRYREIAVALGVSVQRVGELMQRSILLLEADT
jgi:RNA polymerase sigma-70 factor (ECF subfamily)